MLKSVLAAITVLAFSPIVFGIDFGHSEQIKELKFSARVDTLNNVSNAFSPNGDGENDIFLPIISSLPNYKKYQFTVFNRWGELVFESNNPYDGWDGTKEEKEMPAGVYIWMIKVKVSGEDDLEYNGHVTLIR